MAAILKNKPITVLKSIAIFVLKDNNCTEIPLTMDPNIRRRTDPFIDGIVINNNIFSSAEVLEV